MAAVIHKETKEVTVAKKDEQELTREELEEQNGEELPDREVMTIINPGVDGVGTIAPIEPPLDEL